MARLNETAVPATAQTRAPNGEDQPTQESFEAGEQQQHDRDAMRTKSRREPQNPPADYEEVRRNLMRQNRNLARSHSAQSLQIRTLGVEISSLLAANTALKEENIRLRKELSRSQDNAFKSGIEGLKDALSARLKDMAALVDSLEGQAVHTLSPQASPETRKSVCLESMKFRDRPSLREIMSETQMPVIHEMPAIEEAPRLSDASANSPDLGPPPVARFEAEADEPLEEVPVNSINVEARRKRKDSMGSARRRSTLVSPLPELQNTPSSLKAGAKRKISDRDREDVTLDQNEVFQFSRRSSSREARGPKNAAREDAAVLKPSRKVLGEKSTNFSPKKAKVVADKDAKPLKKPATDPGRRTSRRPQVPAAAQEEILPTKEIELPPPQETEPFPKTPAALLLSPTSSEPPSRGVGKADTPPPGDLSISSSTTSIEGTRPSRRARASVNYAEPSLVAKMRRPGKEMLDALSGLQDPRSVMSTSSRRTSQDVVAKSLFKEAIGADSKAQNTRSPLLRKVEEEVELSPIDEKAPLSLGALLAASENSKPAIPEAELDIFEFKDSTPPDSPEVAVVPSKASRRHSAASKTSDKVVKSTEPVSIGKSTKAAVRRKSMMV